LKGKFTHAVKLFLQRHSDYRFAFLNSGQDFFDAFDFDEESQAAADRLRAERGIVLGDGFLVVEENLDAAVDDGAEDVGRRSGTVMVA
jgi:hypothetical protein